MAGNILNFTKLDEKIDQEIFAQVYELTEKYPEDILAYMKAVQNSDKLQIMNMQDNVLFRQPSIFLLLALAEKHSTELLFMWRGTRRKIEPVFIFLGINIEDIC